MLISKKIKSNFPVKTLVTLVLLAVTSFESSYIFAQTHKQDTILDERLNQENAVLNNDFSILPYKQNYILPYYYTGSPYNKVYQGQTPNNEKLNREEVKFQLSFKIPVWSNFIRNTSLYFAYTQLSYWQLYNKRAFFRSTDYEPELFTETKLNYVLGHQWFFETVQVGVDHQSNGFGDSLERSWNRVYLQASFASKNVLISIKPWVVIHDKTYNQFNPNMSKYLGYEEMVFAYRKHKHILSLNTRNLIEHGGHYATATLSYSFPLTKHLNGFVQVFSGYGQSLIEYNHRTNSAGIGLQLNDYI